MNTRKCGCVYADARNNAHVRSGHELGGYLMKPCAEHSKPAGNEMNTTDVLTELRALLDYNREHGRQESAAMLENAITRIAALVEACKPFAEATSPEYKSDARGVTREVRVPRHPKLHAAYKAIGHG